jgi:glycine/D-amino acid oxidase-like deaminating enzyme
VFPDVLGNRMRIPMGHVFYFGTPPGDNRFTFPNMPSWNVPGVTGWPALGPDNRGFRVRTGGRPPQDPDESIRWIDQSFHGRARQILADYFPAMRSAPILETRACHYESSSSRNFIIDHHPHYSNLWISGAGQAEGFKFGPVTGEYTAKRVTGEQDDPEFDRQFAFPTEDYDPQPPRRTATSGSDLD